MTSNGRYGGGQGQEFAQAYQLEYWREGGWRLYTNTTGHQLLQGNVNTYMANRSTIYNICTADIYNAIISTAGWSWCPPSWPASCGSCRTAATPAPSACGSRYCCR